MRRIPTHKETRCQTNKICDVLQSKAVGNVFATDRADKELFRRGLLKERGIRFAALFYDVSKKYRKSRLAFAVLHRITIP